MPLPAVLPALATGGRALASAANSPAGQILQTGAQPIISSLLNPPPQQPKPQQA
jgi:hypothetical protein